jgi:ABC-type phosphate transport system substrate-binding protein
MKGATVKIHKITSILLLAAAGLLVMSSSSTAKERKIEPIVAVVHGKNSESKITKTDLKNIYLGRQTTWSNGTSVEPYMRPPRSDAGFAFLRKILKMTPAKFRYHWQGRQLSGRGTAPPTVTTVRQIVKLVSADKGAVGYVTKSEAAKLDEDVKAERIKLIAID